MLGFCKQSLIRGREGGFHFPSVHSAAETEAQTHLRCPSSHVTHTPGLVRSLEESQTFLQPIPTTEGPSDDLGSSFHRMREITLGFVLRLRPPKEEQTFQGTALLCLPLTSCIMLWLLPKGPFLFL